MAKNLAQFAKALVAASASKLRKACLDALLEEPDPVKPVVIKHLMPKTPKITTVWSHK